MKILVIEDKQIHQQSARQTLEGHEVTIIGSFDESVELFKERCDWEKQKQLKSEGMHYSEAMAQSMIPFPFEAVLTDMMLPMSSDGVNPSVFNPNELVPYGYLLALKAAQRGVKLVGLVTDANHHKVPIAMGLDLIQGKRFTINGAVCIFDYAEMVSVSGTVCPTCGGQKKCDRRCGMCSGTGYNFAKPCEFCNGVGHGMYDCDACNKSGTELGKDWGHGLKNLIEASGGSAT